MKNNHCVREEEIMVALRKGFIPEHLVRHLSECTHCRELSEVMTFLKTESIRATNEVKPPSADFLWWKSQLQKRHRRAVRATRPIAVMEIISPFMLICILIPIAAYLNYSSEHPLLQGVGWAVIIVSSMVTLACLAAYRLSAKNSIHRQSGTYRRHL